MEREPVRIRDMTTADYPAVRAIFEDGIASGDATFEPRAPEWREWDAGHHAFGRLVARFDATLTRDRSAIAPDTVAGWAALAPVSRRAVYAGVAEVSVYVAAIARGRGIGRRLLEALVAEAEAHGMWTLQAGIFPENEASLALHRACGFREVGRRERIGRMNGRWRDVLLLEQRSTIVGT